MMERQEKLLKEIEELLSEQFIKGCEKITAYCEEHSQELVTELLLALRQVMEQASSLQDNGQKGQIKYLVFSLLHSGIVVGKNHIRIDAMDAGFYSDPAECVSYLNLAGIYQSFEEDIAGIKNELSRNIPRIREYEMDIVRYEYAVYYRQVVKAFLQTMLEEMDGDTMFGCVGRDASVQVLFGEYMDRAEVLLIMEGGADR